MLSGRPLNPSSPRLQRMATHKRTQQKEREGRQPGLLFSMLRRSRTKESKCSSSHIQNGIGFISRKLEIMIQADGGVELIAKRILVRELLRHLKHLSKGKALDRLRFLKIMRGLKQN